MHVHTLSLHHLTTPLPCTLLFSIIILPFHSELRGGSWQVTRVVKPDELGKPQERLREQMRKLELSSQRGTRTHAHFYRTIGIIIMYCKYIIRILIIIA